MSKHFLVNGNRDAVRSLMAELARLLAPLARSTTMELDDLVSQAVLDLAFAPGPERSARLCAPDGHPNPVAYRRRVVKNWFVDQYRKWQRSDARLSYLDNWADDEKCEDELMSEYAAKHGVNTSVDPFEVACLSERHEALLTCLRDVSSARRQYLLAVFLRDEFAVAVEPKDFVKAVAVELGVEQTSVSDWHDAAQQTGRSAAEARVRVTHPTGALAAAQESQKRMLRHARAELGNLMEARELARAL